MRRVAILSLLVSVASADSTLPPQPKSKLLAWQARCVAILESARRDLAKIDPPFAKAAIASDPKPPHAVRFTANVPDSEHGRFFPDEPARYTIVISESAAKEAGEFGAIVGSARVGDQASASLSHWSTSRRGSLDVQIAEGPRVHRFAERFLPAIDDCIKDEGRRPE